MTLFTIPIESKSSNFTTRGRYPQRLLFGAIPFPDNALGSKTSAFIEQLTRSHRLNDGKLTIGKDAFYGTQIDELFIFERGELEDSKDFIVWAGIYEMQLESSKRLREL